ncbi:MAG: hypothetical protein ACKOZT_05670 [Cyanobium sp.]
MTRLVGSAKGEGVKVQNLRIHRGRVPSHHLHGEANWNPRPALAQHTDRVMKFQRGKIVNAALKPVGIKCVAPNKWGEKGANRIAIPFPRLAVDTIYEALEESDRRELAIQATTKLPPIAAMKVFGDINTSLAHQGKQGNKTADDMIGIVGGILDNDIETPPTETIDSRTSAVAESPITTEIRGSSKTRFAHSGLISDPMILLARGKN